MNTPAVRFLLVCDTPTVGWVIMRALASHADTQHIGTVNRPSLLSGEIEVLGPTVVILELSVLGGACAGDAITELAAHHPDVRIVVYADESLQHDCLEAGADAFIAIGSSPEAIGQAVRGAVQARAAA